MAQLIPILITTGFLGAGKTTALNAALAEPQLARTAVVVNEFGETALDHLFFETGSNVIELANGCVCCTVRGALADTLMALPLADVDRVVIETSGLADPVPVLQLITAHRELTERFVFGGMIAFADSLQVDSQISGYAEARRQIALADTIMITKLDMVPDDQRAGVEEAVSAMLRRHNEFALIEPVSNFRLVSALSHAAKPDLPTQMDPHIRSVDGHDHGAHTHDHEHTHAHSVVLRHDKPMAYRAVEAFCELLTSAHADSLLRLKGLVNIDGQACPLAIHCIGGVMHEPQWLKSWPSDDHSTRIVAITDGLEPQFVERLFAGFADIPVTDTPDRAAMTDNPLGIPGHHFR